MKKIFVLAAAALALAACDQNNESQDTSPVAARITATIGESAVTRASNTSWAAGDAIGISSTVSGVAKPYVNVQYTTEKGDGEFKGTPLYFYKPMVLTAYYPFAGSEGTAPGNNGIIEASTSAENQTAEKQPKIDFLWDSQTGFTAAAPNVNFTFAHRMSKVTLTFQNSDPVVYNGITIADGVDVSKMVSYGLKGVVLDGTFNTATGECAVKKDGADSIAIKVEDVKHDEALHPLILFPQTLTSGSAKLHIYTNEIGGGAALQHYMCTLFFSEGVIKPGYHYKYTIQVSKVGLIVGKMTVEPWVESERFLIATIDGDKVFKE